MKRVSSLIAALVIIFSGFSVCAISNQYKEDNFSLTFPSDFTLLTIDNLEENEEFINSIDKNSVSSFKKHMQDMSMIAYAANSDNSQQFQLFRWEDSVSQTLHSLSSLDEDLFKSAVTILTERIESDPDCSVISSEKIICDDVTYIKFIISVNQEKSLYSSVQYMTVANDQFYCLAYYNSRGKLTDAQNKTAETVFSTLDIKVSHPFNFTYYFLRIVGFVIIIAAIFVAVFLIRSIVNDFKNSKNRQDIIPDKIEMNRKRKRK